MIRRASCLLVALAAPFVALALAAASPPPGQVELVFDARGRSGDVVVAVFDSQAAWADRSNPVRTLRVAPGEAVTLGDLPPGRYGIMAFLDRNGNGRLDTLPIGLPTEPYGFSQNARGRFGPPSWSAAAFGVGQGRIRQVIVLR